jgi:hypothetical protein
VNEGIQGIVVLQGKNEKSQEGEWKGQVKGKLA